MAPTTPPSQVPGSTAVSTPRRRRQTVPLVILKSDDLEDAQRRVEAAGGVVTVPIFEFPGGRRFHFRDPAGNELAVWAE